MTAHQVISSLLGEDVELNGLAKDRKRGFPKNKGGIVGDVNPEDIVASVSALDADEIETFFTLLADDFKRAADQREDWLNVAAKIQDVVKAIQDRNGN